MKRIKNVVGFCVYVVIIFAVSLSFRSAYLTEFFPFYDFSA